MAKRQKNENEIQTEGGVATKPKPNLKRPPMYRVIILNDDFTPMDFVVAVLQSVFDKDKTEATEIMLQVHRTGIGVCGIYPFEIAETKAAQVIDMAQRSMHPLQCRVEKV